jgi:steroid delta-isomerase-like uncharacterized protein
MSRREMMDRADAALAAWNRGDAAGVVANMAEDVIWRDVALGMPMQGPAALEAAVEAYMHAFPDLHLKVNSYTVDGLRLAQEWTSTGTHKGEIMGIPPTGRWVETHGCLITTCDDGGRVIEGSVYWNPLEMLRQLGLASAVAGASATTAMSSSSPPVAAAARATRIEQLGGASTRSSSPAAT